MTATRPPDLSARELRDAIARGDLSPLEAVEDALRRIEAIDPKIRAFLAIDAEGARARARFLSSSRRGEGRVPPLFGVPVALKDNLLLRGWEVTCASRILRGFRATYDATAVARLLGAGAIPIGRANMDEFAMGSSTENSAFEATRNPWDLARAPGGSSGGSAAAVASRMVPLGFGSDTGGSIRQPAALCGIAGLKPTYGRVSRYGLVAFASSLDQIGPLARTVEDAALALGVIAGADPRDATTVPAPVPDYAGDLARGVAGLRFGVPREYLPDDLDAEVRSAVLRAADALREAGARAVEISLPHSAAAIPTYYLVATSEASSNLARYDGVRYGLREDGTDLVSMYARTRGAGFGPEVKRRILLGTYALSKGYYDAYYLQALRARALLKRDFDEAFGKVDLVVGPTSPFPAFRLGEKVDDPLQMYLCDVFTVTANLVGLPGLSVPCGFTSERHASPNLPIGLQILGRPLAEAEVLRAGAAVEAALDLGRRVPPLVAESFRGGGRR